MNPIPIPPNPQTTRNIAIDALRGAVMILMALDHARDFYADGFRVRPEDLATTTPSLFFTRWITHFCAPVFVFLAGTSAFLYGQKHPRGELFTFLLSRGAWMILLELTIMRIGWSPDPFYRFSMLQVIWAIGWSMVALAFISRLPLAAVATVGAVMVLGHNALDFIHAKDVGSFSWLWTILHEQGVLMPFENRRFFVAYPLVPWIGVMALGYAFGPVVLKPLAERKALILKLGLAMCAAFLALRASNVYGDPSPWSFRSTPIMSLISFLKCTKYPPSLCYLLMTLGPALCALAWMDRPSEHRALRMLAVFGGVPLFYYVLHLILMRWTAIPIGFYQLGDRLLAPPPQGTAGSAVLPL